MRVQVPLSPKRPLDSLIIYRILFFFLFSLAVQNSLSFSFTTLYTNGSEQKCCSLITSHVIYMIHVQMNIFEEGIPIWMIHDDIFIHTEIYKVVLLTNYRTWMRLCNTLSIDIDPRSLVKWKWGWDIRNSRDSSVGRAEDWKSSCHQFKSGSWHMINLYESLF